MSRILVFTAHSADFCSRSGGTLHKHVKAGDAVRVVALTYGERSESGGLYAGGVTPPLDEVKQIRREETMQAAEILGVEIDFLDWEDLSFEYSPERAKQLAREIRSFRATLLLTHHGPDPISMDHDTTWRLSLRAAQMAAAPGLELDLPPVPRPQIYLFEATVPLTEAEGFVPDLYIDITDVWPVKIEAMEAFHRAQGFLTPWYTQVAERRAFQARQIARGSVAQYAEAFERVLPWVGDYLPG
jgi:4-oxalomesaconate hydratase